MVNSQNKGKAFEREIVHLLTNLTGKEWHRVPNSGAFSTKYDVQDSRFKGDLYCEDPEYSDWLLECKVTGEQINLAALTSQKSQIWAWWEQAKAEAKGKIPILIFSYRSRSGHSPIFMIVREDNRNSPDQVTEPRMLLTDNIGIVQGEELELGILKAKP